MGTYLNLRYVRVEDIMEKGVMCAVRPKSAAEAELSSTAAAGQSSANRGLRQQTSTVLTAGDHNFLNYRSTAVGCTLGYCCGPVVEEVWVCGSEYSSGRLLSKAPICGPLSSSCGAR